MVTCSANTLDTDNATDLTSQLEEQEQEEEQASDCNEASNDTCSVEVPDEEQLSRYLQCKRLSEGCNMRYNLPNYMARKNSLHSIMMGEGANSGLLPPVTEGEPMRHLPANNQQQQQQLHAHESGDSHSSSNSLRSASFVLSNSSSSSLLSGQHRLKRHSQDDSVATTCSSSTSLDGKGSPIGHSNGLPMLASSRRRSSTVSQCSSVLSEGTRQQLNFDLSPDLAPDSSILEANTVCAQSPLGDCSPNDERPASPEPLSPSALSDERSCELRPMSRMSGPFNFDDDDDDDDDQDQGDTAENQFQPPRHLNHELSCDTASFDYIEHQNSETANDAMNELKHEAQIRNNLERIISEVSSVQVSQEQQIQPTTDEAQQARQASNKRAHTPFGANIQRNKVGPFGASSLGGHQQPPSLSPGV